MFELVGLVSCVEHSEMNLTDGTKMPVVNVFVQGKKTTVNARCTPELAAKLNIQEGEKYRFAVRVSSYTTKRGASLSVDIDGIADSVTATASRPVITNGASPVPSAAGGR